MNGESPVLPPDIEASLLDAIEWSEAPRPSLKARIMAAVEAQGAAQFEVAREAEGHWITLCPGVTMKILRDDGTTRTWLGRMQPGAVFRSHPHSLPEECLVLEGTMNASGITLYAGDYQCAPADSWHGEVTSSTGCLLLLRTATF